MSKAICIRVKNLRKLGYNNLKEWCDQKDNLYVGRRMRIFIDGKMVFIQGSKWGNPFTLKDYTLEESLEKYKKHLEHSGLLLQVNELKGKNLGCWCEKQHIAGKVSCHAQLLVDLL